MIRNLPTPISGLRDIATNLWWNWDNSARELFKSMDSFLWREVSHNPIIFLNKIEDARLQTLANDEHFLANYEYVNANFKKYVSSKTSVCDERPEPMVYFCAEFGLHRTLPIYSGGLGFLAGDIIKESSDMNLPMSGIGLMYSSGYVKQVLTHDGWQLEKNDKKLDFDTLPIEKVYNKDGSELIIEIDINPSIFVCVWRVKVGRVDLYLLDSDVPQNIDYNKGVTSTLYHPALDIRLKQQIILGIGGYKLLKALGIEHKIVHLNEGHPAFAMFERIRTLIEEGKSKEEAIKLVQASSLFTTHTPLAAATDVYPFDLMQSLFHGYWDKLHMSKEEFFSFGQNPDNPDIGFNMTILGIKMCAHKNGVSKRHGEVSNEIWQTVLKQNNTSIGYVTNGVHFPTWIEGDLSRKYDELFGESIHTMQSNTTIWNRIDDIDDEFLWNYHKKAKKKLIDTVREIARQKYSKENLSNEVALAGGMMLDPNVLTLGFARRMATYKRPELFLHDLARVEQLLTNIHRPVQIIFTGKAHPADNGGKQMLQRIFQATQDRRFEGRIAFIEDYGEHIAKNLVRGVDVWLNNPLPPMEASGTSGMKASMNGSLHLSILDGWWLEGYNEKNGFAFGDFEGDWGRDAHALYDILENQVIPLYYDRDIKNMPRKWIAMMKEAMKSVSPNFSARRMMEDYVKEFYIPMSK